jgi:hypothetical protein
VYSDPVQVSFNYYGGYKQKEMTESLLQKLKKLYITLLQAQKHRALKRLQQQKNLGGYVW